jgi:hypothetical protein
LGAFNRFHFSRCCQSIEHQRLNTRARPRWPPGRGSTLEVWEGCRQAGTSGGQHRSRRWVEHHLHGAAAAGEKVGGSWREAGGTQDVTRPRPRLMRMRMLQTLQVRHPARS